MTTAPSLRDLEDDLVGDELHLIRAELFRLRVSLFFLAAVNTALLMWIVR